MVLPTAAPTGAPAAKVAKAIDRMGEGGNVWARIPSWREISIPWIGLAKSILTAAGTEAAGPKPWKPRRM